MTMNVKIAYIAAGLFILYFTVKRRPRDVSGNVDLGIPIVKGPGSDYFGGTDYAVESPTSEMQRLIDLSNGYGETVVRDGFVGLASP